MATDAQLAGDLNQADMINVRRLDDAPLSLADRLDLMSVGALAGTRRTQDVLARTLDRDVLPRLVLAHRARMALDQPAVIAAREIEQLAQCAMARDMADTLAFLERLRADGMALDAIYLDLLAPAARLLGTLWEDDLVDFGLVTIATDRLRQAMRSFGLAHPARAAGPHPDAARRRQDTHRALLVPGPGDQHSFGLAMVAEFFGRAGWHVWSGVPDSTERMLQMLRHDWYAVVGFSVGSVVRLDALAEAIRKVRRLSRNRGIGVMVGGPVFNERPELVAMIGADATATDGRQAVLQAHRLLDLASRHT